MPQVANDVPRVYGGLIAPSILIEPSRTNLIQRSEGTISQLSTIGDAGAVTDAGSGRDFDNFVKVSRGTTQASAVYYGAAFSGNTTYAISAYVYLSDNAKPSFGTNNTDDGRFVLGSSSISAGYAYTSMGGGLWRVSAVVTTAASPGPNVGFVKGQAQTAKDVFLSGFMLEAGPFVTSYIKSNAGNSTTRALENYRLDNGAPYIKGQAFVLNLAVYRTGYVPGALTPRPVFIELSVGTAVATPRLLLELNSTGALQLAGRDNDGNSTIAPLVIDPLASTRWTCITMTVTSGNAVVYVNGASKGTYPYPSNLFANLSALRLGGLVVADGWEAGTLIAPGSTALDIKFMDVVTPSAFEIADQHARWLSELSRGVVPL